MYCARGRCCCALELDTTSAGLAWALFCIATNPEVEAKVIAEVDAVLGDRDHVEFDDLAHFKYLDRVIKETLRVFPPVPGIGRVIDKEVVIDGIRIPVGVCIVLTTINNSNNNHHHHYYTTYG
jgi:cytochrome P450